MQHNLSSEIYMFTPTPLKKDKKSAHTTNLSFYSQDQKTYPQGQAFLIPNMASFIRDVTEHGNIGAVKKRILTLSPTQLVRLAWWNKANLVSLAKKDFAAGVLLLIQIEMLHIMRFQPSMFVLSDQIVDLSVALKNKTILSTFLKFMKHTLGLRAGIMTNNFGSTLRFLSSNRIQPDKYFFPCNPYGYEMNPTQTDVEQQIEYLEHKNQCVAVVPTMNQETKAYLKRLDIHHILLQWL